MVVDAIVCQKTKERRRGRECKSDLDFIIFMPNNTTKISVIEDASIVP